MKEIKIPASCGDDTQPQVNTCQACYLKLKKGGRAKAAASLQLLAIEIRTSATRGRLHLRIQSEVTFYWLQLMLHNICYIDQSDEASEIELHTRGCDGWAID